MSYGAMSNIWFILKFNPFRKQSERKSIRLLVAFFSLRPFHKKNYNNNKLKEMMFSIVRNRTYRTEIEIIFWNN